MSVSTDGILPGSALSLTNPFANLRASREMCPWGMEERRREQHKSTASYMNKSFPADPPRPGLSSLQRAEGNDVNQQGNYLQQMGPPCSPHVSAQSCCQPSLPGKG